MPLYVCASELTGTVLEILGYAFTTRLHVVMGPESYYSHVNVTVDIIKNASYVITTLLADAVLIYRTFIVWSRNWIILIIPLLLFGVDIATAIWTTWSISLADSETKVMGSSVINRSKYFYAATLALNLFCTAAIYSAALICLIGTSVSNNTAMFFFLNSMPPLIGSVFSYVILRSATDVKRFNTTTAPGATHEGHHDVDDIGVIRIVEEEDHTDSESTGSVGLDHHRSQFESSRSDAAATQPGSVDVHVHLEHIVHRDADDALAGEKYRYRGRECSGLQR
ncbi:hypothetical protein K435DRAFT_801927 [Dendrothele bispora CBS 962.96]|uniref:Uncharacterized protein n=1 Tax=Dendrothele bispora (strain CBS 962.96) TaxID=1314807 RepID=A0A4S8LMQ6_DENBC|nr:hypothetical protein K435DRAFT_801927 [Dendrothele bispora CBS 962.96]